MIEAGLDRGRVRTDAPLDVIDVRWSDPAAGGFVVVELDPVREAVAVAVVVASDPPVAVVTTDLGFPGNRLEMRGPGIWLELVCETPLDHWTVGLEAFGVTVEPGEPVAEGSRGERVPVGLDLDLDTVPPGPHPTTGGFTVPLRVHGEVLVGRQVFEIDGVGGRGRRDRRTTRVPGDEQGLAALRSRLDLGGTVS